MYCGRYRAEGVRGPYDKYVRRGGDGPIRYQGYEVGSYIRLGRVACYCRYNSFPYELVEGLRGDCGDHCRRDLIRGDRVMERRKVYGFLGVRSTQCAYVRYKNVISLRSGIYARYKGEAQWR